MSLNLNNVTLAGRLTNHPELKQLQDGTPVCTFGLAVNRPTKDGKQITDFFNVTAWRERAEFVSRYFDTGKAIYIEGTIQTRSWTDQQGNKRHATDIVVDRIEFVESKGQNTPESEQVAPQYEEIKADDDLPF